MKCRSNEFASSIKFAGVPWLEYRGQWKVFLLPKYRKLCKPTYRTPPRLQLLGRRKLAPMTEDERRVFYEEGLITEANSPAIAVAQ